MLTKVTIESGGSTPLPALQTFLVPTGRRGALSHQLPWSGCQDWVILLVPNLTERQSQGLPKPVTVQLLVLVFSSLAKNKK